MRPRMGNVTKLRKGGEYSLELVVPVVAVQMFGLKEGDKVSWNFDIIGGEKVLYLKKLDRQLGSGV